MLVEQKCFAGVISPSFVRAHYRLEGSIKIFPSLLERDGSPSIESAAFLLRYCAIGVTVSTVAELIGLPLLPLANHTLGSLGDRTDPPYFLVSESERRILLGMAGGVRSSRTRGLPE